MIETKTESFRNGMCFQTSKAIDRLKEGKPGDLVSRDEMEAVIGRKCDAESLGYGNVQSAIRYVERTAGIVWRWDKESQAWRCLTPSQAAADAGLSLKRSGRWAKKSQLTASTIKVEELQEEERLAYRATCVQAELVRLTVTGAINKRLSALAQDKVVEPVDAKKLLSLFV